jgi:hypothetical protein
VKKVYLVSCVSKKLDRPAPARDFYCSEWFKKARRYVELTGCEWFILSAKYGLVAPKTVLLPYNQTLNTMGVHARRSWALRVLAAFEKAVPRVDETIFLAGLRYREFLGDWLKKKNVKVSVPMIGLGIGKQLAWLKQHSPSVHQP